MAGKEIDPMRARSALEVIKQNPGIVLFALSPAFIALGAVWYFMGGGWAIVATIVLLVAGALGIALKR